jgi:hypothetical protein
VTLSPSASLFPSTTLYSPAPPVLPPPPPPLLVTDPYRAGFSLWYTVDASRGGASLESGLQPTAGSITDTIKSGVRRTLSLDLAPTAGLYELLSPAGTRLTVTGHVKFTGPTVIDVPMGVFYVDQVSDSPGGVGAVKITAPDKWARIQRAKFTRPTQSTPGLTVPQQIVALIQGALGLDQSVQITSKCTALTGLQTWEKDRDQAILTLADGAGLWVYFDRLGGAVVADMPTIGASAKWLIDASASGVLLSLDRQVSATDTCNVVVISSSASNDADKFGTQVVWDGGDPTSATYAGPDPINHPELAGPFGVAVDFFDTPLPLTNAQVTQAAWARLASKLGISSTATLTQTPNPNYDAGDVYDYLATQADGSKVSARNIADTVTHSLDPTQALQIQGRSISYDASGRSSGTVGLPSPSGGGGTSGGGTTGGGGTPPSNTPPTGTGYTAYSTLNPGGTLTFAQVLAAVPQGNILTLPAGTFTIGSDFPASQNYACLVVPSNVAGIWGSGTSSTILQMAPNSSTAAGAVPTATGTSNPCVLIYRGSGSFTFKNLQVLGTPQGHFYGGVQFYPDAGSGHYMTGVVVDTVKFVNTAPGNANFPPGETVQLEYNWCDGSQTLNCEMDGRNPSTGAPTSASPLGNNNCTNSYVQDTYCHDSIASMPTYYRCTDIHTVRLRSILNGSGNGNYSGCGINHEQCDGTILHESPDLEPGYGVVGPNGSRTSLQLSFKNDDGTHTAPTTITVREITNDAGPDGGVSVSTNQTIGSITKNGVTLSQRAGGSGGDPTLYYWVYS